MDMVQVFALSRTNMCCRCTDNMHQTIPAFIKMIKENSDDIVFNPKFFEERESKAIDAKIKTVKPIVNYPGNEVQLGFNVGTRGNGKDAPKWPSDLMTEVVA